MLFGNRIRQLREEKQMLQRQFLCKVSANRTCLSLPNRSQKWRKQFAVALEIDTPMYSKNERGERRAKREQVIEVIKNEKELAGKALKIVQQKVQCQKLSK
jgi:transcriptional regulator with XRE-family HTH domain